MSQWSDHSFLDTLQGMGDEDADAVVKELYETHEIKDANEFLFAKLSLNSDPLPEDAPEAAKRFFERTNRLPDGVDLDRIERGEEAFQSYLIDAGVVLVARSLNAGYAAPRLSQVLCISNDLGSATVKRVLGTAQMLLNVGRRNGFRPDGHAVVTCQKMRLMHAGARHVAQRWLPDWEGRHISLEDMLGTLMGFSLLDIEGLIKLDVGLTQEQAEDIYYLWQVVGVMLGIHPPVAEGESPGFDYIPPDLATAREFYETYGKGRHYADAADNPEGVYLAASDLHMMKQMVPFPLRLLGFGLVPQLICQTVMEPDAMERVNFRPLPFYGLLKKIYLDLPLFLDKLWHRSPLSPTGHFAANVIGFVIKAEYGGGEVGFQIPRNRWDLEHLSLNRDRPCLQHGNWQDLQRVVQGHQRA